MKLGIGSHLKNSMKITKHQQKELDEWVSEQERVQGSTARRAETEKQLRQTERIKTRAVEAKRESAMHDNSLLDEIAAQLSSDT